MISLRRVRTEEAVHGQFRGDRLLAASLGLLQAQREVHRGELEKHEFDPKLWKKAKDQLLVETSDKCAYCEAPTAVVSYGDVEHYRPKSIYWWLAYCLENYLVSCAICNQRFKSDEFPLRDSGSRLKPPQVRSGSRDDELETLSRELVPDPLDEDRVGAFTEIHAGEGPLLLNPYFDDPETLFAWKADLNLEAVDLTPRPEDEISSAHVEAAKSFYGLDRKELRSLRYKSFLPYYRLKQAVEVRSLPGALKQDILDTIDEMTQPTWPFAGMIRFFESVGTPSDWEAAGFLVP